MMIREFAWQFLRWICRHPGDCQLLLFLDNELSDKRRAYVIKHLRACDRCRARMMQMEQEWKCFAELSLASSPKPLFAENKMISKIQAAIHARPPWMPGQVQCYGNTETDRQLAAVLGTYLGQHAATALLHAEEIPASSCQERFAGAEAALLTLLGRKGFTAVEIKLHKIMEGPKPAGGLS
jgi:anti-sigma factor RsiW